MARIRTIKPEFPQSETTGSLSRDARLLFVQLWTIADDAGRLRGASRMLASLLYPYDNDASSLMDGWLAELEAKHCIRRYIVDGTHYVEIINWLKHQKIDRPTKSRLPAFEEGSMHTRESSRVIGEASSTDLGPRTVDQDAASTTRIEVSRETPSTDEAQLFDRGKKVLGANAGGLIARLLKSKQGSVPLARAAIEQASTKENPREYIGRVIRGPPDERHGAKDPLAGII